MLLILTEQTDLAAYIIIGPLGGMAVSSGIERVIKSAVGDSTGIWSVYFRFWCNFVLVAEEVHSMEIPSILDELC